MKHMPCAREGGLKPQRVQATSSYSSGIIISLHAVASSIHARPVQHYNVNRVYHNQLQVLNRSCLLNNPWCQTQQPVQCSHPG